MKNMIISHRETGIALWNRRLFPAAEEEMNKWLECAMRERDYAQIAAAANALGACYTAFGRHTRAKDFYSLAEQNLRISNPHDIRLSSKYFANRLSAMWGRGETDRAFSELDGFLSTIPKEDHSARLLLLRGGLALERGNLDQAFSDLTRSAEMYTQQGNMHLAAMANSNLGIVHAHQGELSLSRQLLEFALENVLAVQDYRHAAYALTELGMVAYRQGQVAEALDFCSQSLRHLLSDITTLDRREIANVCRVLALCFRSLGDTERADNYARRALNYYRCQINPYIIGQGKSFEQQYQSISSASSLQSCAESSFYKWEYGLNNIEASLSMIETAESMDQYTIGHSSRVMSYCAILANELQLPAHIKDTLLFAARFHDVGKAFVPREVLTKPDVLLDTEWELMKRHPAMGANMVRMLIPNSPAAELIESHHERYDGTGYPHAFSRDKIPLASHILSVADAYDAMTSNRAYRLALGHTRAMAMLQEESSRQFHPIVIEAWHNIHKFV